MNELYGVFKKFSTDNHYVSLAKSLNSAQTTRATKLTMKQLNDDCAHGGFLIIHRGVCYATFLHNYGAYNDDPFSPTLVLELGIFSLERALADDFDPKKDLEIICFDKREDLTGHLGLTCALKCNSMCLVGDDIYITLGAQMHGRRYGLFALKYDTLTGGITPAKQLNIDYRGMTMPLDDETMNRIFMGEGLERNEATILESTGRWSEYKGEYYTAFSMGGGKRNNGIVVKTTDFETLKFITTVPDNGNDCSCEIASCIFDGRLYTATRMDWGIPYLRLARYDLETGVWKESYAVEDANARPWMFVYRDELYLYNTTQETYRLFANISKIRTKKKAHNLKNLPIDTLATIYDCGNYHSFFVYEDRIFFVCTHMGHLWFGELKLKQNDPDAVNDRLIELFGM